MKPHGILYTMIEKPTRPSPPRSAESAKESGKD